MRSLINVSLTTAAFAIIAGCANMGERSYLQPELPLITEKIELHIPFDKWELTADHKSELARFLKNLRTATRERNAVTFDAVIVSGHTDQIGPLSYNMKISQRLAEMAKDYLVNAENIDPALIFWEGNGPKQPLPVTRFCDNRMEIKQRIDCLAPNRRITIEVVGTALPLANFPTESLATRLAATH